MYQIEWANFDNEDRGFLIGKADSLFLFWTHYLRERQAEYDVLRLFRLDGELAEMDPEGCDVSWWKLNRSRTGT